MKIELGKCYKTRDGRKVGPAKDNSDGDPIATYPFDVPHDGNFYGYTADGKSCIYCREDDIVSEWVEPAADGPVRTVTRREIVPGVYGHITVDRTANDGKLVLLGFKTTGNIVPETRSLFSAHELRSAAMVLSQLAEALDDVSAHDKG